MGIVDGAGGRLSAIKSKGENQLSEMRSVWTGRISMKRRWGGGVLLIGNLFLEEGREWMTCRAIKRQLAYSSKIYKRIKIYYFF